MTSEDKEFFYGLMDSKDLHHLAIRICCYSTYDNDSVPISIIEKYLETGAQWMKERMMKDAVDGVVHHLFEDGVAAVHYTEPANHKMSYYMSANGYQAGDKVKIIVIKEDEQ